MQAPLRPMNLGEILDRTFAIYRRNFLLFAGIGALPATVMLAIHTVDIGWVHTDRLFPAAPRGEAIALRQLIGYGYSHISGFLGALILPAFVRSVSMVLFDKSTSIVGSLRFIAARWRTYLGVAFLKIGAQMVAPELLALGLFCGAYYIFDKLGMTGDFFPLGAVFLLLCSGLVVALFWIGACIALTVPAAVLDDISAWKALRRSWKLTKGSRGRIFVAWLMVFACALVLEGLAAFLVRWIAMLIYTGRHFAGFNLEVYTVVIYFFYAIVAAVVAPLYYITVTLIYYDQRARKEGYDVEIMMQAAGLGTGESGAIPLLGGGSPDFEETAEPLRTRVMKFIRSLRGFD